MKEKINQLIAILEQYKADAKIEAQFKESGMVNEFNQLKFGFFPLNMGIFGEHHQENCKVMVLANDWGTLEDLEERIKGEENEAKVNNKTINNLISSKDIKLNLNLENTFFTNLHLGVRREGTNTERKTELKDDYKQLCYRFFEKQVSIINPDIILCLGGDVRKTLLEYNPIFFEKWKPKSKSIKSLYEEHKFWIDGIFCNSLRRFILTPHPCNNLNFNPYKTRINIKLNFPEKDK